MQLNNKLCSNASGTDYGSGSDWMRVAVAVAVPEKTSVPLGAKISTLPGPCQVSPDLLRMTVCRILCSPVGLESGA